MLEDKSKILGRKFFNYDDILLEIEPECDTLKSNDSDKMYELYRLEKAFRQVERHTFFQFISNILIISWDINKGNSLLNSIGSFVLSQVVAKILLNICDKYSSK